MSRKNTLTMAEDRRARVPFAVIGALLLVTSMSVVYVTQSRTDGKQRVDRTKIFQQTKTEIQKEATAAAHEAMRKSGEKPVTKASETTAGKALKGGKESVFNRYVKLRFYLTLEEKIERIEQTVSTQTRDDVTVEIRLPDTRYTQSSIERSIDRVSYQRTDKGSGTAVEYVSFNAGTVPIIIKRDGKEIARETVQIEAETESAVFDMHTKAKEYEAALNDVEDFMYGPLYGVAYGKGWIERILSDPVFEIFFADIIHMEEIKAFANYGVWDKQKEVFGTTAEGSGDDMDATSACLAAYYSSRFSAGVFGIYPGGMLWCKFFKSKPTESVFTRDMTISNELQERVREEKGDATADRLERKLNRNKDVFSRSFTVETSDMAELAYENVSGGYYSGGQYTKPYNHAKYQGDTYQQVSNGKSTTKKITEQDVGIAARNFTNATGRNVDDSPWFGDFEGQVDDVIEDMYAVEVDASVVDARVTDENGGLSDPIESGGVYRIENVNSGKVLDVQRYGTSNGDNVYQYRWHGGNNQHWKAIENDDGTYRFRSVNSGKVLDVNEARTSNGANIIQWGWHGGDNQRWRAIENDDGTYRFESVNSGKVIGVQGHGTSNGDNVHQWEWHSDDDQRWTLDRLDTASGDNPLDPAATHDVVDTGTLEILQLKETAGQNGQVYQTVKIELPATIAETKNGITTQKTVTFVAKVDIESGPGTEATVQKRGITYPERDATRPSDGPSYQDISDASLESVIPNRQVLEDTLSKELIANDIVTEREFKDSISDRITTQSEINHTTYLTDAEHDALENWLREDLKSTRTEVEQIDTSKTVTAEELLTENTVYSDLTISDTKAHDIIYESSGEYRTVPLKARAELRKRYIDTVNWYIERAAAGRQQSLDKLEKELSKDGESIDSAIKRSKDADQYEYSDLRDNLGSGNSKYILRTSPDAFRTREFSQMEDPSIKPRGEIREDSEPFTHTPLSAQKITPLVNPGFPIIPFPPWWFVSLNYWRTEVRGEYASVVIEPRNPQSPVAETEYIRQPQPVSLKIDGTYRKVGKVEAIHFDASNHIVGVMPGYVPMPFGGLGIGDRFDTPTYFLTCQQWPSPGPGGQSPNFGGSSCPDAGLWGKAITGGLKAGAVLLGGAKLGKLATESLNAVWGSRTLGGAALPARLEIPHVPFMKGLQDEVDGGELKNFGKKIGVPGVNADPGTSTPFWQGAAEVFALIGMKQAGGDKILCPTREDEEGQSGCDDDQLEVDIFKRGGGSNGVVVVESERENETNQGMVIDTRSTPNSAPGTFEGTPSRFVGKSGGDFPSDRPRWASGTNSMFKPAVTVPVDEHGAYVRAITYLGKTFLIALGDSSVNWGSIGNEINREGRLRVDVFIASEGAYNGIADSIEPTSTTVLTDGSVGCTGTVNEVYVTDPGEHLGYRISEEGRLFGPESASDLHCGA